VHRVAGALVAFMVAMSSLVGARVSGHHTHVHVEPIVNFALPPTTGGCGGSTPLGGGAERVPVTVSTVAGQVGELVSVCVGGAGPFPFILDSGAGESIIDTGLANRLHLAHEGPTRKFEGVGCIGTAQPVGVKTWSVAGVPLAAQTLTAARLPGFGGDGEPVGLLGSDVLSRFGAVRLDFTAQTLTFGGPEGPARTGNPADVRGPRGPAPSAVLTQGQPGTTVPLTVVFTPGDISLEVHLRFGHGPAHTFVIDTGSSQTVVATAVAKRAHLAPTDLAQRQLTVCSTITAPLVHSGHWLIPGQTLHPQLLGVTNFGAISADGTAGLLGSDQLQRFGWVILDYNGGRLVLG
jgi:hypothetical protein